MENFQTIFTNVHETTMSQLNTSSLPPIHLHMRSVEENVIVTILVIIICLVSIGGNVLVILAIRNYERLWEQACNMFLLNLAITDMLSAIVVMSTSFLSVANER